MEFSRYRTLWENRQNLGVDKDVSYLEFVQGMGERIEEACDVMGDAETRALRAQMLAEFVHRQFNRPYILAYPCIVDMAKKLPEDTPYRKFTIPELPVIEHKNVTNLQAIEIRFPVGVARSVLVMISKNQYTKDGERQLHWYRSPGNSSIPLSDSGGLVLSEDTTIGSLLSSYREAQEEDGEGNSDVAEVLAYHMPIIATLPLLIDNDLGLLERDICKRDEGKPLTPEILKRAEKRKGLGWSLGRELDATPHTRRPHFAIRWCGPGGQTPKLRPIKGSIVKRKQLTTVPSGYGESDGDEAVSAG